MNTSREWAAKITRNEWLGYVIVYHELPGPGRDGWLTMELGYRPFALTRAGAERKARRRIARLNRPPRGTEVRA